MPALGKSSDRRAIGGEPGAGRLFIRGGSGHRHRLPAHRRNSDGGAAGSPGHGRRRRRLHVDVEHNQCDFVRGIGGLERNAGDQRQHIDRRPEGEHELHVDLRRGLRHPIGIGHSPGHGIAGADRDIDGKPNQRSDRQCLNADLEHDQCHLVHGLGRLEWNASDRRHCLDRRPQRDHDLYADLHWRHRNHPGVSQRFRHGHTLCPAAGAHGDSGREPHESGVWGRVDTHLEQRECVRMHGIRRLERHEGNQRQRIDGGAQCHYHLQVDLLGRGRHHSRRSQRYRERDSGSSLAHGDFEREPCEPRGGSDLDAYLVHDPRQFMFGIGRLERYQGH